MARLLEKYKTELRPGLSEKFGRANVQPRSHHKRNAGDKKQVANRRLRLGCSACEKLGQCCRLSDDGGCGLQRNHEKPQPDAKDKSRHGLATQCKEGRLHP